MANCRSVRRRRRYSRSMEPDLATPDRIATWREAEFLAANHMRSMGFTDAEVTPLGSDGGVDVTSAAAIAQVKHFTGSAVGAPVVQQLIGAANGREHAIFYALNGYTSSAISLAEDTKTALFTYSLDGVAAAVSTAAETLTERGYVLYDPSIVTAAKSKFSADLQTYGQSVIDRCSKLATAMATEASEMMAEVLAHPERVAEISDTWTEVTREFEMLTALITDLGGKSKRPMTDFLTDFAKVEAIGFRLAARIGVDYNELLEVAND